MSDPSYWKSLIKENTIHYILKRKCCKVVLIIAIKCLFFTVFPNILVKFFCKCPWLVYNKVICTKICQKIILIIKSHISVPLTIATFLQASLYLPKQGCFLLVFFQCVNS